MLTFQATALETLAARCCSNLGPMHMPHSSTQGAYNKHRNIEFYTDPALLSRTASTLGYTDTGILRVQDFFRNHVCSGICKALGLKAVQPECIQMQGVWPLAE